MGNIDSYEEEIQMINENNRFLDKTLFGEDTETVEKSTEADRTAEFLKKTKEIKETSTVDFEKLQEFSEQTENRQRVDDLIDSIEASASALVESRIYDWDSSLMVGIAKEFVTDFASEITSAPPQFFYYSYLACLSNLIGHRVVADSFWKDQPRLYVVLLADSGGMKSVTKDLVTEVFEGIEGFNVCHGVGSGEGLSRLFKDDEENPQEYKNLLLAPDEFVSFLQKCSIKGSSLASTVGTLFGKNSHGNAIASEEKTINIKNAYLSFLTATTEESFADGWKSQFANLGLCQRMLLIPGRIGQWKLARMIPNTLYRKHRNNIKNLLAFIRNESVNADTVGNTRVGSKKKMCWDSQSTLDIHDDFCNGFANQQHQEIQNRLPSYNVKMATINALLRGHHAITKQDIEDAIKFMKWQTYVRIAKFPVAVDNTWAEYESIIEDYFDQRPKLKGKPVYLSKMKHVYRYKIKKTGHKPFLAALDNLEKAGSLERDGQKIIWIV